jgi:hypothetical protein
VKRREFITLIVYCCNCSQPVMALGRRAGVSAFTESIGG